MQEQKTYKDFDRGVDAVLEQAEKSDKRVFIIVAGGSCVGKSLFVSELLKRAGRLRKKSVAALKMDDCFLDIDDPELPREGDAPLFDVPRSYHLEEFRDFVRRLKEGEWIRYPCYDLDHNKRLQAPQLIMPTDILLIDGLFAISALEGIDWKGMEVIRVYIDALPANRLKRRIKRDRRYADPETIEAVFLWRILPLHNDYVEPQKASADIVIENDKERAIESGRRKIYEIDLAQATRRR